MAHTIITTTAELAAFCSELAGDEFITIDTEFIREKTYYPQLCLIQVAGSGRAAIIDPLAKGISLDPLLELLNNPEVLKVFHACRQDIEIFYHLSGKVPTPVFDTQIAAMVCGYGEAASYETLVSKLVGGTLDKASRFTDWARRPLTDRQLDYALSDVTHLRDIYKLMRDNIAKKCRMEWIQEEMDALYDPKLYDTDPEEAWRRLKVRTQSPKFLLTLREVAKWRELEARRLNIPRGRLINDDTLAEIASSAPATLADLSRVRGLGNNLNESQRKALIDIIFKARAMPNSAAPEFAPRRILPEGTEAVIDMLKLLLKLQCEQAGIAPRLVADKDELEMLALNPKADLPLAHGWRHEVFGQFAGALMEGKLGFAVDPGKKRLIVKPL